MAEVTQTHAGHAEDGDDKLANDAVARASSHDLSREEEGAHLDPAELYSVERVEQVYKLVSKQHFSLAENFAIGLVRF